jgi:hypothetical protein
MDPQVKEFNNFDIAVMKDYPNKARENAMPIAILKNKQLEYFEELQNKITSFFGVSSEKDMEFLKWMGWEPGMI